MEYRLYRLEFLHGVHFGKNSLDSTTYTFLADTLFSALCQEALKENENMLEILLAYVNRNELRISDAFPYMADRYYLPKPLLHIENVEQSGNSVAKKSYKKLKYIPIDLFDEYLKGNFPIEQAGDWGEFGISAMTMSVSVRGEEEIKPYRVEAFYYNEGCGLYFIVGYEKEEAAKFLEKLLQTLSLSGIGGKRMAGLGRFTFQSEKVPEMLRKRLNTDAKRVMTLSVSLPAKEELEQALVNANYLLEKRSGFVASENYALGQMRKSDLYVFRSGSCFCHLYEGKIYDVSVQGAHPVYRYAKPIFMGVEV